MINTNKELADAIEKAKTELMATHRLTNSTTDLANYEGATALYSALDNLYAVYHSQVAVNALPNEILKACRLTPEDLYGEGYEPAEIDQGFDGDQLMEFNNLFELKSDWKINDAKALVVGFHSLTAYEALGIRLNLLTMLRKDVSELLADMVKLDAKLDYKPSDMAKWYGISEDSIIAIINGGTK